MSEFLYTARSTDGKRHQGSVDAETLNEAMEILAQKNLSVIKLDEKDTTFDSECDCIIDNSIALFFIDILSIELILLSVKLECLFEFFRPNKFILGP